MVGLWNECFRWSLPVNIGNDFFSLLSNLYWLFLCILRTPSLKGMSMTSCCMWSILNIMHIFVVSRECHTTVEEATKIGVMIHKINYVNATQKLCVFVSLTYQFFQ